jgi:ABC-type antimicrobial peptide transport system permease subunit
VYAVTGYSLSKRRREMNIRVALGARAADVIGLLMKQTAAAVLPGVAVGIAGALVVGSAVASLLYEVAPRDPLLLSVVAVTVTAVSIGTALLATRRGLSLNPAAALRED